MLGLHVVFFRDADMERLPMTAITPRHWASLLRKIESSDLRPRSQHNIVMAVKMMANWGEKMALCEPIKFGLDGS